MELADSIYASILSPLAGALLIFIFNRQKRLIEFIFVGSALVLLFITVFIVNLGPEVFHKNVVLLNIIGSIPLAFNIEPLGVLYACVASGLWLVTTIYAIGYMNANQEKHLARFYICFCIAMSAVMTGTVPSSMIRSSQTSQSSSVISRSLLIGSYLQVVRSGLKKLFAATSMYHLLLGEDVR